MLSLLSNIAKPKTINQKINYQMGQCAVKLLGAVPPHMQAQLPRDYDFDAHVFSKRYGSTHYGVMIPDLPEPYRYLSFAAVIGDIGAKITRCRSKYLPEDTATLVHGTALSSCQEAYQVYSIEQQMQFSQSPFRVDFGGHASLFEDVGVYKLESSREDLEVSLTLKPADAMTWFSHSPFYQHFSLLAQYEGSFVQHGERIEVSGLCTLEHWKSAAVSMLPQLLQDERMIMPLDVFSYQVINIDAEQQLVLAFIAFAGQPAYTAVSYRNIHGESLQYDGEIIFQVNAYKLDPLLTPDGYWMEVPQAFRWEAHHQGEKVLDILCVNDTPYCYGLAAGYVSSYQWSGEFKGEKMLGRGYLEYIDRR